MTSDEIGAWRSRVVERSINIEAAISAIICQHYFGHVPHRFFLEVTYDEQFSFQLKTRLLNKIVRHPEKARWMGDLGRLSAIRNYFAHRGLEMCQLGTTPFFVPDPRRPDEVVDFGSLHAEFERLAPGVEAFLAEVFKREGGELLPASPAIPGGDDGENSSPAQPTVDAG